MCKQKQDVFVWGKFAHLGPLRFWAAFLIKRGLLGTTMEVIFWHFLFHSAWYRCWSGPAVLTQWEMMCWYAFAFAVRMEWVSIPAEVGPWEPGSWGPRANLTLPLPFAVLQPALPGLNLLRARPARLQDLPPLVLWLSSEGLRLLSS